MRVARLVRVHDQMRGDSPRWAFNPTTKLLEAVAPLTWTGVRPYPIGDATIRVLRRWAQVGSEGHKRTLRRLSATRQHPTKGRDVCPDNAKELIVGWTGDLINDEIVEGYHVPTAAVSVFDPATIAEMTREENPLTQTSLGYAALWWSPDPNEIVSEGPNGIVGQWMGPRGPELYDCEHILDPQCEIVQRLVRDADFDPNKLGANHFAIALERGRGGVQSELLRVVDSLDIPLGFNPNPVSVQVPLKVRDATWTVGTDRELSVVDGPAWDGDAAAASVFAWAGWDDDASKSKPDPAKAKRAFLVFDADAPELKGSYKLPIARYAGDRLEVLASGLQAAAGYLPKTDIPADVAERARGVLDGYYAKLAEMRGKTEDKKAETCRDGISLYTPGRQPRNKTMSETIIEQITLGVGRDNEAKLRKRGISVPPTHVVRVVDMDAEKIRGAVEGMQAMLADVLVMLGETEEKIEDVTEQGAENEKLGMEIAELKAKLAEKEGQMAKTGDALGEKDATKLADAAVKLIQERDTLRVEVEPLRQDAFARARDVAEKLGVDKTELEKATDLASVRRLAVVHKHGAARFGKATDDMIAGSFMSLELDAPAAVVAPTPGPAPKPGVFNMPEPTLPNPTRDAGGNPAPTPPKPATTGNTIKNNLRALG
jgi:hypothetical protein